METPLENRKLFIIENALRINNYADCDVLNDAIKKLESCDSETELVSACEYVRFCAEYRVGKNKITNLIRQYINEIGGKIIINKMKGRQILFKTLFTGL